MGYSNILAMGLGRATMTVVKANWEIKGPPTHAHVDDRVLTKDALTFLAELHKKFNARRLELLEARKKRQELIDNHQLPDFLKETVEIRQGNWKVADCPADLLDRRVEITGPVEKKMMINAFNSGANVFMADFEDALSPTWQNVVEGQANLQDAVTRKLGFVSAEGKEYKLKEKIATLVVRPRGWHLTEEHFLVEGTPISASLFDFGLTFFHNAHSLLERKSGPYFYLPKMESHLEARLWNDVFNFAQDYLKIGRGTIRATVLIETILAAFEMDEILYELRDHAAGLNAGRWDYIFSIIKKMSRNRNFILPDRSQVTMNVPFMDAYCRLMVHTCHRRGAHAMGGMAAFIPSRKDAEINGIAIAKVKEDKERETQRGFDGTWVAHPDLVPIAKEIFDSALGKKPNQKDKPLSEINVTADQILGTHIDGSKITVSGITNNISVALQYIESWLRGQGAAAINNLMEDAATAEISRAQLWQWIRLSAGADDNEMITHALYKKIKDDQLEQLTKNDAGYFKEAGEILDGLINNESFIEFLTIPAYAYLNRLNG
jgi:malate synthase